MFGGILQCVSHIEVAPDELNIEGVRIRREGWDRKRFRSGRERGTRDDIDASEVEMAA